MNESAGMSGGCESDSELNGRVWILIIIVEGCRMGKKYIPVKINNGDYRIYLENVEKVYRVNKKQMPPIPTYAKKRLSSKISLKTEPESPSYTHL